MNHLKANHLLLILRWVNKRVCIELIVPFLIISTSLEKIMLLSFGLNILSDLKTDEVC